MLDGKYLLLSLFLEQESTPNEPALWARISCCLYNPKDHGIDDDGLADRETIYIRAGRGNHWIDPLLQQSNCMSKNVISLNIHPSCDQHTYDIA
jgi:hypothetical protein